VGLKKDEQVKVSQSSFYPGVLSDINERDVADQTLTYGLNPVSILGFFLTGRLEPETRSWR